MLGAFKLNRRIRNRPVVWEDGGGNAPSYPML